MRWNGNARNRACAQLLRAELNARKSNELKCAARENAAPVCLSNQTVDCLELMLVTSITRRLSTVHAVTLSYSHRHWFRYCRWQRCGSSRQLMRTERRRRLVLLRLLILWRSTTTTTWSPRNCWVVNCKFRNLLLCLLLGYGLVYSASIDFDLLLLLLYRHITYLSRYLDFFILHKMQILQ